MGLGCCSVFIWDLGGQSAKSSGLQGNKSVLSALINERTKIADNEIAEPGGHYISSLRYCREPALWMGVMFLVMLFV